ncbi:MAG: N-6 DNA methylase [Lachnospiraceae bacterium]|nr:N-6 DNA methylase [Lachnospiraceae bacterium]
MNDISVNNVPNNSDYISLKDLCTTLSISTATGRNWIKLGKLIPTYIDKKTPYFTKEYVETLKKEITSDKNQVLKSRRNKKFISGNSLYRSYVSEHCQNINTLEKILNIANKENIEFHMHNIQYLIADCALHLLAQKYQLPFFNEKTLLNKFLKKEIILPSYSELIYALIQDETEALEFCNQYPALFHLSYIYEPIEDILGLIYISCKNMGNRKVTGTYYTPTKVVKKLISNLNITSEDTILDPCCGTGNFLLQLPKTIPFEKIYGNDIDSISVKITRFNMALKYDNLSVSSILEHITEKDYLTNYTKLSFQYIIGNPPWGYAFSEDEKMLLRDIYKTASKKNIESYDVFIEKALHSLSLNGQLAFVLPEALLNVKAHTDIRTIIMESNSIKYLEFLGNAFDGVQCPSILLHLVHTGQPLSTVGMTVCNTNVATTISTERVVTSEYFSFLTTDEEYLLLEKIKHTASAKFLANNADFALGIVTGNNKKYISSLKTADNEIILKGSDICKYHIKPTDNYINFQPENFQQTALIEMYRASEKLLYRFISSQLVFAYDDKQTLSLNSCNIVIPKLKEAKMKYVLAILNSRIAQFIYKMEFHSIKVLRSHIENIPIPIVEETTQDTIIEIVDTLIDGICLENAQTAYDKLDTLICNIFHLSQKEQDILKKAVDGENKFLV